MTISKIKKASATLAFLSAAFFQSAAFADDVQPVTQKQDGPYLAEPFFAHWSAVADLVKAGGAYNGELLNPVSEEGKKRAAHFHDSWASLKSGHCGEAIVSLPDSVDRSDSDKTQVKGRMIIQAKICNAGDDVNAIYIIPSGKDIIRTFTASQDVPDEGFQEFEEAQVVPEKKVIGRDPSFI